MSRLLYAPTTANVDHVSSVTETTLATWSIPANTLGTSGVIHVYINWDYLNNSGAGETLRLRVKYGATTMFNDITPSIPSNAARRAGVMDLYLHADGATNAQLLSGRFHLSAVSATTAGTGDFGAIDILPARTIGGTAAIDSTAAQNLVVTAQNTTNNANISTRLLSAFIEVL